MNARNISTILAPIIVYLLGAFTAWDFNAGNWAPDGRALIGLMAILAVPLTWSFPGWDK